MVKMKRRGLYSLITTFLLVLLLGFTSMAVGTVTITADKDSVVISEKVNVKIETSEPEDDSIAPKVSVTYNDKVLQFESCDVEYGGGGGLIILSSTRANLVFTAKKTGETEVKVEAIIDDNANNKLIQSKKITVAGAIDSKSSDSTLKALSITKGTLDPAFSPKVTNYTVELTENVDTVAIDAKTNSDKASVVKVEGFTNLKEGENLASIVVKSEAGTTSTYSFKINKSSEQGSEEGTVVDPSGQIKIEGSDLYVNATYPSEMLPPGCDKLEYNYKGTTIDAAYFEMGNLVLLYLSQKDGSQGAFYIYYSGTDEFIDFIQIHGIEGRFIFPVQYVTGIPIPDGFIPTTFKWGEKEAPAYIVSEEIMVSQNQYSELSDEEDVNANQYSIPSYKDYYLFFAMSSEGSQGWYLYDTLEGTYQRYLEIDTQTSQYDDTGYLTYKSKSQTRMVIIAVLIFIIMILGVVLVNFFIKIRELQSDCLLDEEEQSDSDNFDQSSEPDGSDDMVGLDELEDVSNLEDSSLVTKEELEEEQKEIEVDYEADEIVETVETNKKERFLGSKSTKKSKNPVMINLLDEMEEKERAMRKKVDRAAIDDDFEFEFINIRDDD